MYKATVRNGEVTIELSAPTNEKLMALVALYEAWERVAPGEPFYVDDAIIVKPEER